MIHIIRGDIDDKVETIRFIDLDESDELDVDEDAAEYLIPQKIYEKYIGNKNAPAISDLINISNLKLKL